MVRRAVRTRKACTHMLRAPLRARLLFDGIPRPDALWQDLFLSMIGTYGVAPNVIHCGCIIDLLGRAGKLTEALETIGKMPMRPNSAIWGTLLAACRVHGNSEIGESAAKNLLELDPENSMPYILSSNLYAESNRWEDVQRLRQVIMEKGIKKEPCCSLIEMNGTIHDFVAGDRSYPMRKDIYSKLDKVLTDLKNAGYVPDVTEVFVQVTVEKNKKFFIGTVKSWQSLLHYSAQNLVRQ